VNSNIASVVVNIGSMLGPSGSITASNCVIPENQNGCSVDLDWNTVNPVAGKTSAVTTPINITVATGNSGKDTFTMGYGDRTFFLYHNSKELSQATANASCSQSPVATSWDGSNCVSIDNLPSGSITASNCVIPENQSGCSVDLDWNTVKPIVGKTSAVTTAPNLIIATGNSGKDTFTMGYGDRTFFLYHNTRELSQATANASCSQSPTATVWDGSSCVISDQIFSGSIKGADCTIPKNASTCNTTLTLNIVNPIEGALTAVTKSEPVPNTLVVDPFVASSFPVEKSGIPVEHMGNVFYLNHNGLTPANVFINATCVIGTGWNMFSGVCEEGLIEKCPNPEAVNYPLCTVNIDGECLNGSPSFPTCPDESCTLGGWSGCSATECGTSGVRTIDTICTVAGTTKASVGCQAPACGGGGGGGCVGANCGGGGDDGNPFNINFHANPSKIYKGNSTLLQWTSSADYCYAVTGSGLGVWGGTKLNQIGQARVTPTATTKYEILCVKDGKGDIEYATVTVGGIVMEEK
jgi:hypothetical protein